MTRWWDSDKTIARGAAPGTRGGRPVRLHSRPATRDIATERPPRLDPPPDARLVIRPRLSFFRARQWIAVTAQALEARDAELVVVLRRTEVEAIQTGRRIAFLGAGGRVLGTAPAVYGSSQLRRVAAALGVRVL
jgi:hypothetical protein